MDDLAVECYSGHTYAQEPQRFTWLDVQYTVIRVSERWRTPEGPAFRVHTRPAGCFRLHYLELEDRWHVGPAPERIGSSANPANVPGFPLDGAGRDDSSTQGEEAHK